MFEDAAGAVLLAGAGGCAAALVARPGAGPARAAFVVALALAAAAALGGGEDVLWLLAVLAATAGLMLVVLERFEGIAVLSWLDAVMGATSVSAVAILLGADAPAASAAGGIAAGLSLSRWQPSLSMGLAAGGIALLGTTVPALAIGAAMLFVATSWRREERVDCGPAFRYTVLAAIVLYAISGLTLLALNQFTMLSATAGAVAIVTVVAAIARGGVTVTDRIRESERHARTDELTGLANRRHLLERLDAVIAEGREIALLLIDLDGFKELNDTLGHHAGDEMLRQIGPRLANAVREHDTLARLGGDEFALVLAPSDETGAATAGLRLRHALEESFEVEHISVHINASVGVALWPQHADSAAGLLQRADVAMYEAKRRRTGLEIYLPSGDPHSRERLALVGELHHAIDDGQLVLHYQPKASLVTGEVRSVEALVRWQHPERGLLAPSEFLPIAEHSGLTRALTTFVIGSAIEQMQQWRQAGLELSVAVNLGPADLLDLGLPTEVAAMLAQKGCPPERIQLEVSEDIVMADPHRTLDVLSRLRALDVTIALDDFGKGQSSLSHLKTLRVDELKLDRSFVLDMTASPQDAAIVQSTIDLGRRLHLRVVAEGVATPEAWDMLADWGCDEAQGFLLARPMPADEVAGWLAAHEATRAARP